MSESRRQRRTSEGRGGEGETYLITFTSLSRESHGVVKLSCAKLKDLCVVDMNRLLGSEEANSIIYGSGSGDGSEESRDDGEILGFRRRLMLTCGSVGGWGAHNFVCDDSLTSA